MKTLNLSSRAGLLKPSPTLSITAKANAMKAEGINVISFAAGEPDFDTPEPVKEAAIAALRGGFTKYTASSGIKELKDAIVEKLQRENGLTYSPDQIVVSCGAKHSVYNALQVLIDPGDEVLLIAPYWMTYAEQIRLAGGEPVVVRADAANGFIPEAGAVAEAIGRRTKAFIVNSPCNPTGAVFPPEVLQRIADLADQHGLWIISDEIYERLIYGSAEHRSLASFGPSIAERTVTIGGCSKSYSMTGWRIGFAASPTPVAKAMNNLQDQVTSNPTSFAQKGAAEAFHLPWSVVEEMRAEFAVRRDLIVDLLEGIPGVEVPVPQGAFYVLADFNTKVTPRFGSDLDLASYLLDVAQVATVPGSVFEAPGFLRMSYATSRANIEEGVKRISEALENLV